MKRSTHDPSGFGLGWLTYLLAWIAAGCFTIALSLYTGFPFSRETALRLTFEIKGHVISQWRKVAPHRSQPDQVDQTGPWSAIELRFNLVESFLTEQNCQQSRKNLAACVAVVNRLLDYSNTPSEFVPGPAGFWAHLLKREVQNFGFAHIRKRQSNSGSDLRQVFEQDKKQREKRELAWSRMRLLHEPMPFESVARWLKYELINSQNESEITATAYNTYLSVAKDPHSQILPMTLYSALFGKSAKVFTGFGFGLKRLGDNIYVSDLQEGAPAERAGLRLYDILRSVDSESVSGLTIRNVLAMLQAPQRVQLTVSRAGRQLIFDIPKAEGLALQDVSSTLLGSEAGLIGYIKLARFSKGVCQNLKHSLEYFNQNDVYAVIVDLRGNAGGDLMEGICATGLFLKKGVEITRVENLVSQAKDRVFRNTQTPATQLPLTVLINARSASASEIFAGAIQEHGRGLLIGERSFGKGTTQVGRSWSRAEGDGNDKKFLYFSTVGRFLLPSGYSVQVHGVQPDLEVYASPHPSAYDRFAIREKDHLFYIEPTALSPRKTSARMEARLARCRMTQGRADQRYTQLQKAGVLPDYVLITAQHWAKCLNEKPQRTARKRL